MLCIGLAMSCANLPKGSGLTAGLRTVMRSGLQGDVTTVENQVYKVSRMSLGTVDIIEGQPNGVPIYQWDVEDGLPEFERVQRLFLHDNRLVTRWIGSRPDKIEYFRLGSIEGQVPPPPDWAKSFGQVPPWKPGVPAEQAASLPFLNHALFCWADSPRGADVYIFRQAFEIADAQNVARATLRIATNARPQEAAFNNAPLHLAGGDFNILELDVTPLLQAGRNIFAIQLGERPDRPNVDYGMAWHLELVERQPGLSAPPVDPYAALLTTFGGDRIWGRVSSMHGDAVELSTPYGPYRAEWSQCAAIIFPRSWNQPESQGGLRIPLIDAARPGDSLPEAIGIPLRSQPEPLQDTLLLSQGRRVVAKPSYATEEALFFESEEGSRYSLPLAQVQGIFPPRPINATFRRPEQNTAVLFCQLTTTAGERISGWVREMNQGRIVLETAADSMMFFNPQWVDRIEFPYHAAPLTAGTGKPLGLLGLLAGQEAFQVTWEADSRRVQSAAFAIGLDTEIVLGETIANISRLNPREFPVLVSVDPIGEYLYTWRDEGDAMRSLHSYVRNGGVLMVLSRGGALRGAVTQENGRFLRRAGELLPDTLAGRFNLKTVRPTDSIRAPGIQPFDQPPNRADLVYFQRESSLPAGLGALPRRIAMAPMITAPFYPMIPTANQGTLIYSLMDSANTTYGPALMLVPVERGWVVIIDHLLWDSVGEGHGYDERILPILLRWAYDRSVE